MADTFNSTTTTTTPGYTNPAHAPHGTTTHATHLRETERSTNWFAWLLGGAVIAVGIGALVYSGGDGTTSTVAPGNNVTIEAPANAPAAGAPTAPADPVAPAAPMDAMPDGAAPGAAVPAPDAPAVADPVAPAPDVAPEPAPAAPVVD